MKPDKFDITKYSVEYMPAIEFQFAPIAPARMATAGELNAMLDTIIHRHAASKQITYLQAFDDLRRTDPKIIEAYSAARRRA